MSNIIQYDSNFLVTDSTLKNVVWVTYGTTTYAQVLAYANAGQVPCVERNGRKYILSSTDTNYEVHAFYSEGYSIQLWNSKDGQSNVWVDAEQRLAKVDDLGLVTVVLNREDYFTITNEQLIFTAVPPLIDLVINNHKNVVIKSFDALFYLRSAVRVSATEYTFTFIRVSKLTKDNTPISNTSFMEITLAPYDTASTITGVIYDAYAADAWHKHGDIDSNGKSVSFPTDVRRFLCADGNYINPDYSKCKPIMGFQFNSYAADADSPSGDSPYIYKIFSFSGYNQWTSVYIRATWLQGFGAYINEPPLDCTFWIRRGGGSSYPSGTVALANIYRVFSVSTPHPAVASSRSPFNNLFVRVNGTTIEVYLRMWANGNYQQSFVIHEYCGNYSDPTFYNYNSSNRTDFRLSVSSVQQSLGSFTYYGAANS